MLTFAQPYQIKINGIPIGGRCKKALKYLGELSKKLEKQANAWSLKQIRCPKEAC